MLQFQVRLQEFVRQRRYRRALVLFKDLKPEMEKTGDWLLKDAASRLQARGSEVSIGRLIKSLVRKAYKRAVTIASVLPYARIQQEGGEVKPNKRKWLAIPLRLADKRAHLWPKHVAARPGVLLRFVPISATKALLIYMRLKNRRDNLVEVEQYPRWLLLKKVRIPGRPYLVKSAAVLAFMRGLIVARLNGENRKTG